MTDCYYKVHQVLQSVTDCNYKVRQVLKGVTDFTKSAPGITKCDSYFKVRRNKGYRKKLQIVIRFLEQFLLIYQKHLIASAMICLYKTWTPFVQYLFM